MNIYHIVFCKDDAEVTTIVRAKSLEDAKEKLKMAVAGEMLYIDIHCSDGSEHRFVKMQGKEE